MEKGNPELDPRQSLELIESMINRAKDRFAEDGFLYLLWGWVVLVCSLSQFILLHFFKSPYHYLVWMACWVVLIYQFYYIGRKRKRIKVRTYTDYIIKFVWITFAIVIFIIGFLIGRLTTGEYYSHINPIVIALYGMPVFLSGIILRFQPLIIGGIACWILSIITTFIGNYDYQFLMIPVAMLVAWIIPGYLLRAKFKQQISTV